MIDHDATLGRNAADQVMELPFDGGEVVKDVRVIELKVVEDGGARTVMNKLAALVEKSGVVFVGLDDEIGAVVASNPCAESGRDLEVQWHAAHQKARL